jgi:hypothetical protein
VNSGTIWGRFVEKTRGQKSRATVPLTNKSKIAIYFSNGSAVVKKVQKYLNVVLVLYIHYCYKCDVSIDTDHETRSESEISTGLLPVFLYYKYGSC